MNHENTALSLKQCAAKFNRSEKDIEQALNILGVVKRVTKGTRLNADNILKLSDYFSKQSKQKTGNAPAKGGGTRKIQSIEVTERKIRTIQPIGKIRKIQPTKPSKRLSLSELRQKKSGIEAEVEKPAEVAAPAPAAVTSAEQKTVKIKKSAPASVPAKQPAEQPEKAPEEAAKEMMKTCYEGDDSYKGSDKQEVRIQGNPKTNVRNKSGGEFMKKMDWKVKIRRKVHQRIKEGLRQVGKSEKCNLFVTFYIDENRQGLDIDNLLKVLFDSLKYDAKQAQQDRDQEKKDLKQLEKINQETDDKSKKLKLESLIESWKQTFDKLILSDDASIRGIRAEKEMVKTEKDEGVKIQYVITKSFKIRKVEEKPGKKFRNYWKSPMQYITAEEVDHPERGLCFFIDNTPGRLFLVDNKYAKLIPPGYDWKKHEGETVDGCMVFEKKVQEEYKNDEKENLETLHWLTKW